jgi:hypothetical protein
MHQNRLPRDLGARVSAPRGSIRRLMSYPVRPHHLVVFVINDVAVPDIGSLGRIKWEEIASNI